MTKRLTDISNIIADKSIETTYSPAELPEIIRNIRGNYRVDVKKMNRYAGRRGKAKIIEEYMRDQKSYHKPDV